MPETTRIDDAGVRARALDPTRSFLVQAPAGSGKTELLIQRYLRQLARVVRPEAVVAITFTKKAAGEMRRRVLEALAGAGGPEPEKPHEAETWRLARAVQALAAAHGWNLAGNPSRLGIRTIDSLCSAIASRMPWLSRFGAMPEVAEDASELYQRAARATIAQLADPAWAARLEIVLLHLDNDFAALEKLLIEMLKRRDQWLRHLPVDQPEAARPLLEKALCGAIGDTLAEVRKLAPGFLAEDLPPLARHAASHIDAESEVAKCAGLEALPGCAVEDVAAWRGIAALLLTDKNELRKKYDVRQGFPPGYKCEKKAAEELLASLRLYEKFLSALAQVRTLPPPAYSPEQWEVLSALVPVLVAAYANLRLEFRAAGQVDFSEVAAAALEALGSEGEPTDVALVLDGRIEHLLVDEFQDTSITQFELLKRLTAGWTSGDGRTLFAVGDPMQSIYRFREAEVGLFLHAGREGLGGLRLDVLRLTTNFRSNAGLVAWTNQVFPNVLKSVDDVATGAVSFAASTAAKPAEEEEPVAVHPLINVGDAAEADCVVKIIEGIRERTPLAKVAVLVRARTHLPDILRALSAARFKYRAVDIDQLGDLPITQDLLALTRALLHPADRIAWLAVLRAPWCGLTLADLLALTVGARRSAVCDLMHDEARIARLSEDGRDRAVRTREVLDAVLENRAPRLRSWIEGCWLALGGPACASRPGDMENGAAYFDLLDGIDDGGDADLEVLAERAKVLFAGADPEAGDSLQVMTIHKAKGLEFDCVILPGLGRYTKGDEQRLLAWLERPGVEGEGLILAPIKPAGEERDPVYKYVSSIEKQKSTHETARLLYVAATRARSELHLVGCAGVKIKDGRPALGSPRRGSLLDLLWDAVEEDFERALHATPPAEIEAAVEQPEEEIRTAPLVRLPLAWQLPEPPAPVPLPRHAEEVATEAGVTFDWVGDTLRHIGTVVHRMLQQVAQDGMGAWDEVRVQSWNPSIEAALRTSGVPPAEVANAAEAVRRAVCKTLASERGRWIFDASHEHAESEFALNGVVDGKVIAARVDRTFVDAEGTRWIVDFKSSAHEGGDVEAFLDTELERYRKPMTQYRRLLARFDPRPVRMGLYFPLLDVWREYETAAGA